jgi:hypothetical protein
MSQKKKDQEIEYTQAVVGDSSVNMVLDPRFMGLLTQKFPDAKVVSLIIAVSGKTGGSVNLFHPSPESSESKKMTIDGSDPEVFKGILQVFTDFTKKS